jgi:hypothetical protein
VRKALLFRWRIQDVSEPLDRHRDLLEILPELRQVQDRCGHLNEEYVERDESADRQYAGQNDVGTE